MKMKLLLSGTLFLATAGCSAVSSKASIKVSGGEHYLEYGFDPYETDDEVHPEIMKWITSSKGDLTVDYAEFDPYVLGEQTIFLRAETEDSEAEEAVTVIVRDTKAPVIELASDTVYIRTGSIFDPTQNIISVYDEADGEYEPLGLYEAGDGEYVLEEPFDDWGFYVIDDLDVDVTAEGRCRVRIIAADNHGNRTEGYYTVVVTDQAEGQSGGKPVTFCDEVKEQISDIPAAVEKILQDYCRDIGGSWDEGCYVLDPTGGYDHTDEGVIDDPYEEDDEEYDLWEDEEVPEEYPEEEEEEPLEDEEEDPWDEEEEDYEDSDPEQDCYDMGGVWYPGDGCAWPDDEDE